MFKYIPSALLCAFTARLIYKGAEFGDGLALLALASLYAFEVYTNKKADTATDELKKELENLKGSVNSLKLNSSIRR